MKKHLIFVLLVASVCVMMCALLNGCDLFGGVEIESIEIISPRDFKVSGSLGIEVKIEPANAKKQDVVFEIDAEQTTAPRARIEDGILRADGEGIIVVFAKSVKNEVKSEPVTINAMKEPVVSVRNTNTNTARFVEMQNFDTTNSLGSLGWQTSGKVEFLTNDNNAKSGRGMISLRAQDAGIYRTFKLDAFESVTIQFYTSNRSVESYKSYYISKIYENGVWQNYGDTIQCNVGDWKLCTPISYTNNASAPKEITIGFFRTNGNSVFVNPTVFIDDMTITINTRHPFMRAGTQLALTSEVQPFNATYKSVTYQIVSSETTAVGARIENDILYADKKGQVKIYPIADGVYGEPFIIEVI